MMRQFLLLLALTTFTGCAARSLDDLSSSYERLAKAHSDAQQPTPPTGRGPTLPPSENLGASFLAVGRAALEAAAGQSVDPQIRIAFYRIAAASAHFVLVEEALTGNPVTVTQTARASGPPAASAPGASAAVVMRRARSEGIELCNASGQRPTRDCAYLTLAESLALLAVQSEPWIRWPSTSGLSGAARVAALRRAPDATFNQTVADYRAASQTAMGTAAANDGLAGSVAGPNSLATFIRANDQRASCIVTTRALLGRHPDAAAASNVIDRDALGPAAREMEQWVMDRHRIPAPTCQS